MSVDTTQLRVIAERVRRQTTNRDILELCEVALARAEPVKACPVCEARRAAKAAAQKRWRNHVKELDCGRDQEQGRAS